MGASRQPEGEIRVKFFEYSENMEYFLQPDIAECDTDVMIKPGFDLILSSNITKELGVVLDSQTNEIIIDEISLPMRDINKVENKSCN
jgi:hypothetical protein